MAAQPLQPISCPSSSRAAPITRTSDARSRTQGTGWPLFAAGASGRHPHPDADLNDAVDGLAGGLTVFGVGLAHLQEVSSAAVTLPSYAPWTLHPGIVRFDMDAEFRALLGVHLDQLAASGSTEWGVCGVSLSRAERELHLQLEHQDHLYTVLSTGRAGSLLARVVGVITRTLDAAQESAALQAQLAATATRIVSVPTLDTPTPSSRTDDSGTEGATASVLPIRPGTRVSELRSRGLTEHIVEALDARRASGAGPFTVLTSASTRHNGDIARETVLAAANEVAPDLAAWISEEVSFPNSVLVGHTATRSSELERRLTREVFGISDMVPVLVASTPTWVIEDRFCAGRPPLEQIGVLLVDDAAPYEDLQQRVIRGAQFAVSCLGQVIGHHTISDACDDPVITQFVRWYLIEEVIPTLRPTPGIDPFELINQSIADLRRAHGEDLLSDHTDDGTVVVSAAVRPVIDQFSSRGGEARRAVLIVAAWSLIAELIPTYGSETPVAEDLLPPDLLGPFRQARTALVEHEPRRVISSLSDTT